MIREKCENYVFVDVSVFQDPTSGKIQGKADEKIMKATLIMANLKTFIMNRHNRLNGF